LVRFPLFSRLRALNPLEPVAAVHLRKLDDVGIMCLPQHPLEPTLLEQRLVLNAMQLLHARVHILCRHTFLCVLKLRQSAA
jgi:hypothetical protein